MIQHFFIYIIFLINLFLFSIEAHEWSSPDKVLHPTCSSLNVSGCSLARNSDGFCVAVWFDPTGTGSLYGARLVPGSLDSLNRPNWILTSSVNASSVQMPSSSRVQSVGMDLAGNAMVTWTDGNNNIFVSLLPYDQNIWNEPQIINTQLSNEVVHSPSIVVASDGNAVVTWTSSQAPGSYHVLANAFDARANTWKGQQQVLGDDLTVESEINAIDIDVCGNAILVIATSKQSVQAITYDFFANNWTPITPISTNSFVLCNVSIDIYGNAIVVWIQSNDTLHTALLPKHATAFVEEMILSTSVNSSIYPAIAMDQNGNAVTAWADLAGNLSSARFIQASSRWEKIEPLYISRKTPTQIELSIDFQGDAAAIWVLHSNEAKYAQTAQLAYKATVWKKLFSFGSKSERVSHAHIVKTNQGNSVAIWLNNALSAENQGVLKSSMKLGAILPPLHFQGKVIKRYSGKKANRIHRFTWIASPDPTVVKYQLYANEKRIASIPGKQRVYQYNVPNRSRNKLIDYTLIALDNQGNKSEEKIVKLP